MANIDNVIINKNNRAKFNSKEATPLGVNYVISGDPNNQNKQTAFYSLPAQKRKTWFIIDLETGDNWIPEEDAELQEYIYQRDRRDPNSPEYMAYNELVQQIYAAHPAFSRKQI